MNSAYKVSAFAGASMGSFLAGQLYAHYGWPGDCWLGGGLSVMIWLPALLWRTSSRHSDPAPSALDVAP